MKRVIMGLSDRDLDNVEFLSKHHHGSKASAVSQALAIANLVIQTKNNGGKVILTGANEDRELIIRDRELVNE